MSHLPFYKRPPQTFLRYEDVRFEYPHASGTCRVAHYLDKKKKPQVMDAQILWDLVPFTKDWFIVYGPSLYGSIYSLDENNNPCLYGRRV